MSDQTYNLAVRLSLQAGGLVSGAAMVMSHFKGIQGEAAKADALLARMSTTYSNMVASGATNTRAFMTVQSAMIDQTKLAALANDKLARAQRGVNQAVAGAAVTAGGFLGLDLIKGWVKDAEGMQDALAKVSLATTGTSAQLTALQAQSYTVAGQTARCYGSCSQVQGSRQC